MKLIGKNILIDVINEEIKRYSKGKVVEPGTDVDVISKEDVIYYDKRQGYTMLIDNKKFTVIQERDVVVVL